MAVDTTTQRGFMRSRWSEEEAAGFVARYGAEWGPELALRTYSARLLGVEPSLVLHGGGNSSVKTSSVNVLGDEMPAIFVKASGADMATIEPAGHLGLDLAYLLRLRAMEELDDATMVGQLRTHMLQADSRTPSIEALVHAFLPAAFVDHTHADVVLALTNRPGGEAMVREALGEGVIFLPYITPGFKLARATASALEARPDATAIVWSHHGVVTWGASARESYEAMIAVVSRAEEYLESRRRVRRRPTGGGSAEMQPGVPAQPTAEVGRGLPAQPWGGAQPGAESTPGCGAAGSENENGRHSPEDHRLAVLATIIRGLLACRTGDCDRPYRRMVVQPLTSREVLDALAAPGARGLMVTPPLTTDHLIRTKPLPLWVEGLDFESPDLLREQLENAVDVYRQTYEAYLERHATMMPPGVEAFDPQPRVVLMPGVGAFCAGLDLRESTIVRDITEHTIAVKQLIAETTVGVGTNVAEGVEDPHGVEGETSCPYLGLGEAELFAMEYRTLQHAKLSLTRVGGGVLPQEGAASPRLEANRAPCPAAPRGAGTLRGHIALITGAAGAIGSGICQGLLEQGSLVVATDLPGEPLDNLVRGLDRSFPGSILGVPLDVTDPASVSDAFAAACEAWGGIDLVIPNAGIAAVAPLAELDFQRYRRLERVNVEGTLLVLAEAARLFKRQRTGGDIVLVSTKNVFAPGANFGAYSSTKAAAHQLARVAGLELAADDVRVNMVAPDAVFSHGACRSGLWAEVGPDRMKARGLDEAGLEAYYQSRNLLKVRVTAEHVANAVLFFATRMTPTTGATLPVDGGLPDATPR